MSLGLGPEPGCAGCVGALLLGPLALVLRMHNTGLAFVFMQRASAMPPVFRRTRLPFVPLKAEGRKSWC